MTVKRIVAVIAADRVDTAGSFYVDVLGMTVGMDLGWIVTFVAEGSASPQVSVAAGCSCTTRSDGWSTC